MSIVAEMLCSTGKLAAKEDIHLKADALKRKVEDIKVEVLESLKNQCINFSTQYVKLDKLIDNLNEITNEYDNLCNQIEKEIKPQMKSSVAEFNDILDDISRTKKLKSVALNVSLLYQHVENAKKAMSLPAVLNAANHLIDFENVLENIETTHQNDIDIIVALSNDFFVTRESFISHLESAWHDKICINSTSEIRKCITLKFNKMVSKQDDVELLSALKLLNHLKQMLKEFGNKFLSIVVEPILLKIVQVKISEDRSCLTINIIKDHFPEPKDVFNILTEVLEFLVEFFNLPTEADENESCTSGMNELGLIIADDFCNLVIEKCLKAAIPKRSKDLDTFHQDIMAAENFCNILHQVGFITENGNKILNFIHDVDTLPVNKMTQDILSRARCLMQESLHQTVVVGVKTSELESENVNDFTGIPIAKKNLSKYTFAIPQCQISESLKSLIELLYEVKDEAKSIGPVHSSRLYYVSRNICELYCSVILIYHKEEVANIPQQTAIFHNNCMYLAHRLGSLGSHFELDLQPQIKLTFLDLIHEIRKLGTEAFLAQMRNQKTQLLQLLQDQQAYVNIMSDDNAVSKAEKSIRQCLYQLQLLKKVWSDVLPIEVYFKSIGTLLNTCLEEIILRILAMEDITADAAAQFDSIFDIILKQSPDLFKVSVDRSNEVHRNVKRWYKFQELQIILNANMREIIDRWSSGKGPLASHFTAEEVKHLVRALFQNTERRAAALAKIR